MQLFLRSAFIRMTCFRHSIFICHALNTKKKKLKFSSLLSISIRDPIWRHSSRVVVLLILLPHVMVDVIAKSVRHSLRQERLAICFYTFPSHDELFVFVELLSPLGMFPHRKTNRPNIMGGGKLIQIISRID